MTNIFLATDRNIQAAFEERRYEAVLLTYLLCCSEAFKLLLLKTPSAPRSFQISAFFV
jgi:hypothetical protein